MRDLDLPKGKKIYFISDHHLGAPTQEASKKRELYFVSWLQQIQKDAAALFIVGDLFDFWFDYKTVVPKGFTRTLGTLAQMADAGLPIFFFVGNHDLWMDGYFEEELGIPVFHKPQQFRAQGKTFFVGHGDGLGPHDEGFKRMKKVFVHPLSKWLFRWLHPDIGVRLAQHLSVKNKMISGDDDIHFLGEDKEWLVQYAKRKLEHAHYDYFVFGHRHLPMEIDLGKQSTYVNLGDWINHYTYAAFDGERLGLVHHPKPE
ncbi:UDP-2,3-diacylglucosamine diphosphatase [Sediminicola luteus]|uniref:UDP-2,3-diacylglucosamine hydrolase n=1 Tax=Sediminicola luteus TaxID=319238 RepID=A0A2A4G4S1_9FLAO|nr:UDP-2,3-diacylglucosamine diphosphatase [Sediminicola luteus]PCE62964.1 UDP-2,3-diacylglucosamine hydrolase [Sediminicola luteus]